MPRGRQSIQRSRKVYQVEEVYSPLDLPKMADDDVYTYRWVRGEIRGQYDFKNVAHRRKQGFTFADPTMLPVGFEVESHETTHPRLEGVVRNGYLLMMKIPT